MFVCVGVRSGAFFEALLGCCLARRGPPAFSMTKAITTDAEDSGPKPFIPRRAAHFEKVEATSRTSRKPLSGRIWHHKKHSTIPNSPTRQQLSCCTFVPGVLPWHSASRCIVMAFFPRARSNSPPTNDDEADWRLAATDRAGLGAVGFRVCRLPVGFCLRLFVFL